MPLLEVVTRRYYGNQKLADVTARDLGGCRVVTAEAAGPEGMTLVQANSRLSLTGAIAPIGADSRPVSRSIESAVAGIRWTCGSAISGASPVASVPSAVESIITVPPG